ncbi:MAG: hypothetical protein NDJ90_01615 [Oligoflexia bacterium]|nr:hypothetical protein [Oligoflexia bacterium]
MSIHSSTRLPFFLHPLFRPALHALFALACAAAMFAFVELKPRIGGNFFFSSDDPQLQGSKRIEALFELPPQIILTAEGDVRSRPYLTRAASLTAALQRLNGVQSIFSLGAGPSSVNDAMKSPLWSRLVIAADEQDYSRGSNFIVNLEPRDDYGELVERINAFKGRYDSPEFRLAVSGTPYVVHEIQKKLVDDMKSFSLAAVLGFSAVIFAIYRSGWILFGAIVCGATATFLDFLTLRLLGVDPGPLSANLWSIVAILTLSHVVFISGNWELLARSGKVPRSELVRAALRETGTASLWSMITNSLGFLTLLFTAAKPIRQFGLAGMVGAILALVVAYSLFPAYLRMATPPSKRESRFATATRRYLSGPHATVVIVMIVLALIGVAGFHKVDTQPPLYSYFEKGGRLREDLLRIDHLGGSSPFYIALKGQNGEDFRNSRSYLQLWQLQVALERHRIVGEVISLPVLLGEVVNSPFAPYLSWDKIYAFLDLPALGKPGRGFVTEDRKTALFVLRMKESELGGASREAVIKDLLQLVRDKGFDPILTGGLFELTGQLSTLVSKSLLQGVFGLSGMLFLIALIVSRSLRLSSAVACSLVFVPVGVLGAAGHLHLPLEIISTPGINLAMGLGVDETIHLIHRSRKGRGEFDLEEAKMTLWRPISASCGMLALGFSVFWLSHFPPSRNMGWLVVIGSVLALVVMLLIFPTIADGFLRLGRRRQKPLPQPEREAA